MDTPLNAPAYLHQLPAALFETQAIGHGVAQLVSKDNRAPKFLHLPLSGRLLWPQAGPLIEQRRAIFLDRDGVVVEDVHYLRQPAQISLLPGIIDLIRALQDNYFIIIVTNQSGLARGFSPRRICGKFTGCCSVNCWPTALSSMLFIIVPICPTARLKPSAGM
jgi:hypothetical protein